MVSGQQATDFDPRTQDLASINSADSSHAAHGVLGALSKLQLVGRNGTNTNAVLDIPASETLHDEFFCALRKKILLQGRLYVFDSYLCFNCSLFGYMKKRVIPMRDIIAVRKKSNFHLPNSIEVEWGDGRKEFFTSFLSRSDAYKQIMRQWTMARNGPHELPSVVADTACLSELPQGGSVGGGMADVAAPSRELSRAPAVGRAPRPSEGFGKEVDDDDDDDADNEAEEDAVWAVEQRPVPAQHAGVKPILHCTLPGTTRDFFETVLSDRAAFFEDFLESQGNRRINISSWKQHEQLGHVRDLNFVCPIKGAFANWGVSHAACYQSHRFTLYAGEHIVFESSQTMSDIPYGDCFTVDLRWDVKEDPTVDPDTPHITLDIHIRVPFLRRCLFKPIIESGSYKQVQDTYTAFVQQLRGVLQERVKSRGPVKLYTPRAGQKEQEAAVEGTMAAMQANATMRHNASMRQLGLTPLTIPNSHDVGSSPAMEGQLQGAAFSAAASSRSWGSRLQYGMDYVVSVASRGLTRDTKSLLTLHVMVLFLNLAMFFTLVLQPKGPPPGAAGPPAFQAPDTHYWQGRLQVLHQEVGLLQGRLEHVVTEISQVMQHLGPA